MLSALDFAETRSQGDARLLSSARSKKKGERLSEDEAKALRRKVGGTASESPLISDLHATLCGSFGVQCTCACLVPSC